MLRWLRRCTWNPKIINAQLTNNIVIDLKACMRYWMVSIPEDTDTNITKAHWRNDTAWRHRTGWGFHRIALPCSILQLRLNSTICLQEVLPRFLVVTSGFSKKLAIASPKMHRVVLWSIQMTVKMHKHLIRLNNDTTISGLSSESWCNGYSECIHTYPLRSVESHVNNIFSCWSG